jgi:hypothetical protein
MEMQVEMAKRCNRLDRISTSTAFDMASAIGEISFLYSEMQTYHATTTVLRLSPLRNSADSCWYAVYVTMFDAGFRRQTALPAYLPTLAAMLIE